MMTIGKELFYSKVAIAIGLVMILAGFLYADHSVKKGGHDLYWKNWIALADDDAFVNDSLVEDFLDAEESLKIDTITGELVVGSERRAYSPDRQVGWLLQVMKKVELKNEQGQVSKVYSIKSHLVFDFRVEEK